MVAWRTARSLDTLLAQFNQAHPDRSKASDGSIGDAAHASRSSDHNPWVDIPGEGANAVTARDFTHDPQHGMDIGSIADQLQRCRDTRIKYVICNGQIMSGAGGPSPWVWRNYKGSNPHRKHLHLSVVSNAGGFDDARLWGLGMFAGQGTVPPAPAATMPAGVRMLWLTRPNMRGADVRRLQEVLNRDYPLYAKLKVDEIFGRATDRVVREFQRRSGLTPDGKVGPVTRARLRL